MKSIKKLIMLGSMFFFIMLLIYFTIAFAYLPNNLNIIFTSGFSNPNLLIQCFSLAAVFTGLMMLIPIVRDGFKFFPWLYSYSIILLLDLFVFGILEVIINYGYEIQNDKRHIFFIIIGFIEVIIGRIAMCIYFHKKPLFKKEDVNHEI